MKCPECGYEDSKVIDSRPAENKIRRRRECLSCKCRFTTYEMVETIPLMVVKKDNTIEPFDRDKLINRLARATVKRPVQIEDLEKMVEDVYMVQNNVEIYIPRYQNNAIQFTGGRYWRGISQ